MFPILPDAIGPFHQLNYSSAGSFYSQHPRNLPGRVCSILLVAPASHCDIAWAAALSTHDHLNCASQAGAWVA